MGGTREYLHCIAVAIEFTSQGRKDRIIDYYEVLNVGFSHKVFREGDVTDKDKILRMLDDDIHIDCVSSVWVVSLTPAVPSFAFEAISYVGCTLESVRMPQEITSR